MADRTSVSAQAPRRVYLVERFWPGVTPPLAAEATARLRQAAAATGRGRRSVRHLSSSLLPDDEVLFTFVEADSVTSVRALGEQAAFAADRITESLTVWPSGRDR